jgi:bacterioferritin
MAIKGTELVQLDVKGLIKELNKALADEWLAYYQYWIGAKVIVGPLRSAAVAELTEHAADELRHADMLVERIIQLDGTPLLNPKEFGSESNCGYLEPSNPKVKAIIEQGVEGERCAIEVYNKLLTMTKDKDLVTYDMLLEILKDEIEHEADFMALLDDLAAI